MLTSAIHNRNQPEVHTRPLPLKRSSVSCPISVPHVLHSPWASRLTAGGFSHSDSRSARELGSNMPHFILWVEIDRATKPSRRQGLKSNISMRGRDNIVTWQRAWIWGGVKTGGQWCDMGGSYGHLHRRHDERKPGVCKMSHDSSFLFWLFWKPFFPAVRILCIQKSTDICPLLSAGMCVCVLVAQSCPTLCDPMDWSPLGSSVHGILQARILEWVAVPCSNNPQERHFGHLLSPSCSNLGKGRGVWGGGRLEGRNLCKFCK